LIAALSRVNGSSRARSGDVDADFALNPYCAGAVMACEAQPLGGMGRRREIHVSALKE